MSGATPLPLGRQRENAVQALLADLAPLLQQLREALPLVNDEALRPRLDRLRDFADSATSVLERRVGGTDQALIDDIASLLGNLHQVRLPTRDPEMGFTVGLQAVNGARGQIAMALYAILTAGNEMRLRPSQPEIARIDTAELPKAPLAGKLAALEKRLDDMVAGLDRLEAANTPTRIGLVRFYLGEMRVELSLAKLSLTIGDTSIDFASLTRAVEAMVRLTGDFVATLRGWAERVAAPIRAAGDALLRPVRRVAGGVRAVVGWMSRKLRATGQHADAEPPADPPASDTELPPDFSLDAVKALILAGKQVPPAWVPFVTVLDLSRSDLTDATSLAGLTALQTLDLGGTWVSDATPLAGLTALQALALWDTQVSDVTPLAGLIALRVLSLSGTQLSDVVSLAGLTGLQILDLSGTRVEDATPLAGLTGLQFLDLGRTQVSDVMPLAGLTVLRSFDLRGTKVGDATPLAGLTTLQALNLSSTRVIDAASLAGLTALQSLNLSETQVSNATSLAGLTALRTLNLSVTQISDATPLASLAALQTLNLSGTQVSDASPLAGLTALETLDLTGTRVIDVSALQQPRLKVVGGPSSLTRAASAIRRTLFGPKP